MFMKDTIFKFYEAFIQRCFDTSLYSLSTLTAQTQHSKNSIFFYFGLFSATFFLLRRCPKFSACLGYNFIITWGLEFFKNSF